MPPTQEATRAAGRGVEPRQLALHLHRQLARRRDDERLRLAREAELRLVAEQRRGHREAVGDRLARAGLRRDEQVAAQRLGREDRGLHVGRGFVAARGERLADDGGQSGEWHSYSNATGGAAVKRPACRGAL